MAGINSKGSKRSQALIEPGVAGAVMMACGLGAALNYALYPHLEERFSLATDEMLMRIGYFNLYWQELKTFLIILFGALSGLFLLLSLLLLKTMIVRFLLSYNGWFLTPKHPLNKVWFLLMYVLVGTKNRGIGKYQDYLPSLPVPPLNKTLKKYLNNIKPLVTPEEYKQTEAAVKAFSREGGWKLQLLLKLKSWVSRNWIKDWWVDIIYLKQRSPIPFNSNYFALGTEISPTQHGIDRAAELLHYYVKYRYEVLDHTVENYMGGKVVPMCSMIFKHLHCTARIPQPEQDKIVTYGDQNPTHVVVLRKGKFFCLEMFNPKTGHLLSPLLLKAQLEKIVEMAGESEDENSVAALTALPRTEWAGIRKRMEERPANKKILKLIDSALTLLALQSDPVDCNDMTAVSQMLFQGDVNSRWFDKSVTLVACPNGAVGASVEHAPLDATVCTQIWEYCLTREKYDQNGHVLPLPNEDKEYELTSPKRLSWELEGFRSDLSHAVRNLQSMISDNDMMAITAPYGKRVPKAIGLSPDGWFQMAMQLAYYRLHKKVVLTYESATTRLYYQGRTETIRPVSTHSVDFVKTFDDPNIPREEVKKSLKKAIDTQCQYKLEAMRGLGVDRHLFGLYVVAKGLKLDPMPTMFTDKAFNLSFDLSTSQTPVKLTSAWTLETSSCLGGFGAVTDQGYGVCYIIVGEDKVNFSIHSKRSCADTDSTLFADGISKAFNDMRALYNS